MRRSGNGRHVSIIAMLVVGTCVLSGSLAAETLPGVIHHWPADGDALDAVGDSDGTLLNGASYGPSPAGQSFDLTGAGDYVSMSQPFPPIDVGDDFTVSLWMNLVEPSPSWGGLFETRYSNFFGITIAVNPDGIPWFSGRCDNSTFDHACSGSVTDSGAWHHVVAVFDWTMNETHLYVDGSLTDTATLAECSGITQSDKLYLGVASTLNPIWEFNGFIDEIQVYDRALSGSDVSTLYDDFPVPVRSQSWGSVKSAYR